MTHFATPVKTNETNIQFYRNILKGHTQNVYNLQSFYGIVQVGCLGAVSPAYSKPFDVNMFFFGGAALVDDKGNCPPSLLPAK